MTINTSAVMTRTHCLCVCSRVPYFYPLQEDLPRFRLSHIFHAVARESRPNCIISCDGRAALHLFSSNHASASEAVSFTVADFINRDTRIASTISSDVAPA